jgi:electron transport complex protein RnfE
MKAIKTLTNGLIKENPTFRLVLGTCPTLAITTSAINGIGMGLATTAVLIGSNAAISLTRKVIPDKVRIPAFVTIIAGFVTIVQMLLKAYVPALDKALGIYIPLIVVNCIILARAEMFASKNSVGLSILDGIGMGLGFTMALLVMGTIRELLGNGTLFGVKVTADLFDPAIIMILPPGGFLAFGITIGLLNRFTRVKVRHTGCASCNIQCSASTVKKEMNA